MSDSNSDIIGERLESVEYLVELSIAKAALADIRKEFSGAFTEAFFNVCALHDTWGYKDENKVGNKVLDLMHCVHFTDMNQPQKEILYFTMLDYLKFRAKKVLPEGYVISEAEFPKPAVLQAGVIEDAQTDTGGLVDDFVELSSVKATLEELKADFSAAFAEKYFRSYPLHLYGYSDEMACVVLEQSQYVNFSDMNQSQKNILYLAMLEYLRLRAKDILPKGYVISEAEFPKPAVLQESENKDQHPEHDLEPEPVFHSPSSNLLHPQKSCPFLQGGHHQRLLWIAGLLYAVLLAAVLFQGSISPSATTHVNVYTTHHHGHAVYLPPDRVHPAIGIPVPAMRTHPAQLPSAAPTKGQ